MADRNEKRELNKKRLRENLIDSEDEVEVRKRRNPAVIILLILLFLGIAGAAVWYVKASTACSGDYETVWEKEMPGTGAALTYRGFRHFRDGLITFTKDGAEYTDGQGNTVWQKSYQMNNPVCSVNGDYAVVIDRGGTTGCIFSGEQTTGEIASVLPISEAEISGRGVTYAVLNDSDSDFISVYRKDGTELDITVKSVVDGDGYPFSIGVDPTGSQLVTSYVSVGDGSVTGSVVFRNFGEVGQNQDGRRVVGGFIDEFAGHIVTKVGFADEEHAHAFYDGGVVFFSTKVLNQPEILKNVAFEDEMLSVAEAKSHVAVILDQTGKEKPKRLEIYDQSGNLKGSAEFDVSYQGFEINEKTVVIWSPDHILAYDLRGRLIADLTYDGRILAVTGTDRLRELIVSESGRICRIRGL